MADKPSGDKAGEKNFFARTAKNTTKKAKRAQEKVNISGQKSVQSQSKTGKRC